MRLIVCNLQMFSNDQVIYVYEGKNQIYAQKTDMTNLANVILQIAKEFDVTHITLSGQKDFAYQYAGEIQNHCNFNFKNQIVEVEVI